MATIFTPSEAAAFVQLPAKRVYKELEYRVITSASYPPRLPFSALIYLRALKEINFTFSVDERIELYRRLVEALEQSLPSLEIAKFFILQLDSIQSELSDLIMRFNAWKQHLVASPDIMGGETVFPGTRLTVRHVGAMLERGESPDVIREDYPYLSSEDIEFASLYVRAYPSVGRPKKS
jgi:uncharacterized protein (DUF433 family)